MGVITQAVMVQAAIDVNGMGQAQKVRLADEIFAQQPNLLASILALPRMGVGMVVRISANVTDDFGNVTGLSGRC
jgi:hypothetical protein